MNLDALRVEDALLSACEEKSPEEVIEICNTVINEADRLIAIAQAELDFHSSRSDNESSYDEWIGGNHE